ncbi:SIMPL domain-containing protein [Microlunatus sp. GCM10028923]|uniref:SIMPL domain-containing protein n=1 Tax=Microlunatus sp. GCM10028923 TaxID=3273400 RepID=UPI00360C832E
MNGSTRCRDRLIMVGRLVMIMIITGVLTGCSGLGQRTAAPPDDWRTEQYRDVTFRVPADWAYAYEPGPDWCGHGLPDDGPGRPYVSLGEPSARLEIACPALPDNLITEHVAVLSTSSWPTTPPYDRPDGRTEIGNGFWEATRTVASVRLRVISRDATLAQRIADSAAAAGDTAPCRPDHPVITDHAFRPEPAVKLGTVDRITLCQYDLGGAARPGGVRAAGVLAGAAGQKLIKAVGDAPVWDGPRCPADEDRHWPDLTVVLRVHTDAGLRELILRQGGCSNGAGPVIGGFDDGRTVRTATAETCRAVLVEPLRIDSGSGSVFARCVTRR